jgi:hypothetical protein
MVENGTHIEKPVTLETLIKVAEAGYPDAVRLLAGSAELKVAEGASLISAAEKVLVHKLTQERDTLANLLSLSDHPTWISTFEPMIGDLSSEIEFRSRSAAETDRRIEEMPQAGARIPYSLRKS